MVQLLKHEELKREELKYKPICPLMTTSPAHIAHCVGDACGWWDDEEGTCALVSLSRSLRYLTAVPDILRGNVPL